MAINRYNNSLWDRIPEHMRESLKNYIEHGIQPGHFITAVLSNDLKGAISRADSINQLALADYIRWLYNYAPQECWGSGAHVVDWIKKRKNEVGRIRVEQE
jgi:hypothetical protein